MKIGRYSIEPPKYQPHAIAHGRAPISSAYRGEADMNRRQEPTESVENDPGCVKTRLSQGRPELFSPLLTASSIYQYDWFGGGLPKTGIFQMSAEDYRLFRSGTDQIRSLETHQNFTKACRSRAFLALRRVRSPGAPDWLAGDAVGYEPVSSQIP